MLSVICPTYNRAGFLPECIGPLMEIPQGSIEVVVVDDCSTDDTSQVCDALVLRHGSDRLRYLRLERNEGAPAARNYGLLEAQGDVVMFVDSDDVPIVSGISNLLEKLRTREDLEYAYGQVVLTDVNLRALPDALPLGSEWDGSFGELAGYHWHTMGAVYRRSCLENVGPWDPELTGSQDWEFQARVKAFGGKGSYVPVIVGYWRQHSKSRVGTSTFRPDYIESVMRACASIISHARKAGMCDKTLQHRIARRLLVHAVAFGGEGHAKMKKLCLAQAAETAPDATRLQLLVSALKRTPQTVDFLADLALRRIQNRP